MAEKGNTRTIKGNTRVVKGNTRVIAPAAPAPGGEAVASPEGGVDILLAGQANVTPGEKLLRSLFRLIKVVRIYKANNNLMLKTIEEFRQSIGAICVEEDSVNLRVHRGRFYLNRERLVHQPNMLGMAAKMADYLQARDIQGIRFYEKGDISGEEIVRFVELLNRAEQEKDPISWLQVQLDVVNYTWIEILVDQDFKLPDHDPGLGKIARGVYSRAMATMARKSYSAALTSMISMMNKLSTQRRVGIQRSKRVIQDMIDILTVDESILLGMSTIRDYDDYTYTHSVNVAILCMCVGKRLGLQRAFIEQLGLCGLFHDLGKVDIPVELITKQDYLTDEEYELVKTHSLHSVRQIIKLNADHVLKAKFLLPPFEHHLGLDLSGYPKTDRKEPLSLLGRILAVADQYDAMTSSRSYRPIAISPDRALKFMLDDIGTKLDPLILKTFVDMIGIYPVGCLLVLDTGEVGLAVETPEDSETGRPIVRLLVKEADEKLVRGDVVDLSERDERSGDFRRNIAQCFHPSEYGIQPANFLV